MTTRALRSADRSRSRGNRPVVSRRIGRWAAETEKTRRGGRWRGRRRRASVAEAFGEHHDRAFGALADRRLSRGSEVPIHREQLRPVIAVEDQDLVGPTTTIVPSSPTTGDESPPVMTASLRCRSRRCSTPPGGAPRGRPRSPGARPSLELTPVGQRRERHAEHHDEREPGHGHGTTGCTGRVGGAQGASS